MSYQTDPATGRPYWTNPATGQTEWLDQRDPARGAGGKRRHPALITILILGAGLVTLAGIGVAVGGGIKGASGASTTFTVTGKLSVSGSSCNLARGYNDITPGAQVTITDGTGTTVALGQLGASTWEKDPQYEYIGKCVFPVSVSGVPRGKGFYGVEVAHRGAVRYAEANITTTAVELQLG